MGPGLGVAGGVGVGVEERGGVGTGVGVKTVVPVRGSVLGALIRVYGYLLHIVALDYEHLYNREGGFLIENSQESANYAYLHVASKLW